MKPRRLFASAGHSTTPGRDRGASSHDGKHVEGVVVAEFRQLVFDSLMRRYGYRASVDSNDSILSQTIKLFRQWITPNCILIEFHCNASVNPKAQGVEVFIPENYTQTELEIATKIAAALHGSTGFPYRNGKLQINGVKTESESARGKLGWLRLAGQNVLPELFFITNPQETLTWNRVKFEAADRVADVLWEAVNRK